MSKFWNIIDSSLYNYVTGSEKRQLYTHNSKTHYTIKWSLYVLTNNSSKYWCWKLPRLLLLWLVSEACQISTGAWVTFEWLHLPSTSRQPAVIHHMTGWWAGPWIHLHTFVICGDKNGKMDTIYLFSVMM